MNPTFPITVPLTEDEIGLIAAYCTNPFIDLDYERFDNTVTIHNKRDLTILQSIIDPEDWPNDK